MTENALTDAESRSGDGGRTPARRCGECGARAEAEDRYCEACGIDLTPVGDVYAGPRAPRDHVERDVGVAAGVSDRGLRHHDNQDALAVEHAEGPEGAAIVVVVCDGVSSAARSAEASEAATAVAAEALVAAVRSGTELCEATRTAAVKAGAAVAALAIPGYPDAPSCTYVSAIVTETSVVVGWLGDSRAYWLSPDQSTRLTEDDSWATLMAADGMWEGKDVYADARSHAITRWLGADAGDPEPRTVVFSPEGPGAVLVCSDGLWNYIPDAEELSAAALPAAMEAPAQAARSLVRIALDAGGHDNVTVAVVPFPPTARARTVPLP